MPDYNLDYYEDYDDYPKSSKVLFQPGKSIVDPELNENPRATLLTIVDRMRAISNVADVFFEPSLTSPHYTGTFADGQRITFDPYNVDWEQLERTCRHWSREHLYREFGKAIANQKFSHLYMAKKIMLSAEYGVWSTKNS